MVFIQNEIDTPVLKWFSWLVWAMCPISFLNNFKYTKKEYISIFWEFTSFFLRLTCWEKNFFITWPFFCFQRALYLKNIFDTYETDLCSNLFHSNPFLFKEIFGSPPPKPIFALRLLRLLSMTLLTRMPFKLCFSTSLWPLKMLYIWTVYSPFHACIHTQNHTAVQE